MGSVYQASNFVHDGDQIDLSKSQTISCQVHGSSIDAYQLIISVLSTNAVYYDSTKVTLSPVLWDKDILKISLPITGVSGNFKYTVTCWSGTSSAISRDVPICIYRDPTIQLIVPLIINTKSYDFTALYNQPSSLTIKGYQYILYDSNFNIIKAQSKGMIYNASLSCSIDGLINGNDYYIECQVTNSNDLMNTSGLIKFTVTYDTFGLTTQLNTTILPDESAILVSFGHAIQIIGNYTGNIQYVPNYLITGNYGLQILDSNSNISFKVKIPPKFQYTMNWDATGFISGIIVSFDNGAYTLSYDGQKFIMQNSGVKVVGLPITLSGVYLFAMRSLDMSIIQDGKVLQNLNYN